MKTKLILIGALFGVFANTNLAFADSCAIKVSGFAPIPLLADAGSSFSRFAIVAEIDLESISRLRQPTS